MDSTNSQMMIEAVGLCKFYGSFIAIEDVSFGVPLGQVAAFLGPNGAGKTTTMRLLTGYLAASRGTARLAGMNIAEQRIQVAGRLGYLPENGPLYPEMTPLGLLKFLGQARGMVNPLLKTRIDTVISQCSLEPVLQKTIRKLSRGYRQRLGLAQALLHDPDILIMDEPTSGLDPNQIREVRALIRSLGRTKAVLLSTHILQEVEAVADHVLVINEGRLAYDGPLSGLTDEGGSLESAFYRLTSNHSALEETVKEPPVTEECS
jgi:ABC-2 type transport system ATP-binding protein